MTSTSSDPSSKPSPFTQGSRPRASSARRRPHRPSPPPELREAGLSARKALGQHFVTSSRVLRRIAEACELAPDATVIEVGAGLGGLTAALSAHAGRVIAVELDETLVEYLRRRFANTNVAVIQGDALALDPAEALSQAGAEPPYVVAGNLPYYVAQPLLRHFLEATPAPERLVVMVQAEVAESIVAQPGDMSLLSVSVQLYGDPRLLFRVPPSAFYPPPKVRSAVVRIDVAPRLRAPVDDIDAFFRVVRAGFGTKRKQLRNALAHGLAVGPSIATDLLATADIDATLRAQALSLEQWASLTRAWVAAGRPEGER
ncbi:MAG: 16S rRNA (adenine(1518)-N(6)/adenine(1519)-N(6))-dimethyltransferase RsmA [Dehalococcoidia bacterium]